MTRSIPAVAALVAMASVPLTLIYGLVAAALGGKPDMASAIASACLYISGALAGHLIARVSS